MATTIITLVLSLVVLLGGAVLFTNAVEILGQRLQLGGGAVGSVLAAVGTAMPETMIPLVAIVTAIIAGGGGTSAISVGAIIGAPFLLITLGMFILGASAIGFRRRRQTGEQISVYREVTRRDIGFFLPAFLVAGVAGFVPLPLWVKVVLAIVLVGAYAHHVRQTLKGGAGGGESESMRENLLLWPEQRMGAAPNWVVGGQVIGSVVIMVVGAYFFVHAVEQIAALLGVPAGLIALILAPLATELPEKGNSIYWFRDSKDPIGVGNMTGAMVFQSTIPVALGLVFTPWDFGFRLGLAVAFSLFAGTILYLMLRSNRPLQGRYFLGGGALYVVFVAIALYTVIA